MDLLYTGGQHPSQSLAPSKFPEGISIFNTVIRHNHGLCGGHGQKHLHILNRRECQRLLIAN